METRSAIDEDRVLTKPLLIVGALGVSIAVAVWIFGYWWAGHVCMDQGFMKLLGGHLQEGSSIRIDHGRCVATQPNGPPVSVALAKWRLDTEALNILWVSLAVLASGMISAIRQRR